MQKVNLKHDQLSASNQTAILPSIYHNIYTTSNTPLVDYFTALEEIITKTFFKAKKIIIPIFKVGQQDTDKMKRAKQLERVRHI